MVYSHHSCKKGALMSKCHKVLRSYIDDFCKRGLSNVDASTDFFLREAKIFVHCAQPGGGDQKSSKSGGNPLSISPLKNW